MRGGLVATAVVAAATYVVGFALGEHETQRPLAGDIYGYWYPNMLYALRRLAEGGRGLLWNPFQSCGEPFFAISSTGLLYPGNLLFLVLDPAHALRALLLLNLVIGGAGMVGLLREMGVGEAGAAAGALAFILGGAAHHATTWMPTVQVPYAWTPVALWACERLVRAPSVRRAVLLGLALAMGLLPGHPQFVMFTCELIALRLLWALASDERRRFPAAVGGVLLAAVVMLLVTAVQLLPGVEVAGESVRHASLGTEEIEPQSQTTLDQLALQVRLHAGLAPFDVVPGFLALAAVAGATRKRAALFYLIAAFIFLQFVQGDATTLGQWHLSSPTGQLFRRPARMVSVIAFCSAVLAGFGIDALTRGSRAALVAAVAGFAAVRLWTGSIATGDWMLAGVVVLAGLTALVPRARRTAPALAVGALALVPLVTPHVFMMRLLPDDASLGAHAALLARLHAHLTPDARVHLVNWDRDPGFIEKTAALHGLHAVTDYEPQTTRRYGEFLTALRVGAPMRSVNDVYYPAPWNPKTVRLPLLDLAAVRYVVLDKRLKQPALASLRLVDQDGTLNVYENAAALPRAYYVPHALLVLDAWTRLSLLASRERDPRDVALLEAPPPSGFFGEAANTAHADARFVVDEPERVVIETAAPARGFLFLADQWFPGWSARVNGVDTPILVANHVFRLVEVPAGPVTVEFRYRPTRVWIGAAVSLATVLAIGVFLARTRPVAVRAASAADLRAAAAGTPPR